MSHYFTCYHNALDEGFPGFASVIAALFSRLYGCDINEAYASACRNGTAPRSLNCPGFVHNCGPSGSPDI